MKDGRRVKEEGKGVMTANVWGQESDFISPGAAMKPILSCVDVFLNKRVNITHTPG